MQDPAEEPTPSMISKSEKTVRAVPSNAKPGFAQPYPPSERGFQIVHIKSHYPYILYLLHSFATSAFTR